MTILQVAAVVVVVVVALVAAANQKQVRDQRSIDLFDLGKSLGFDEFCPNRDSGFVMGWGFLSPLSHGDDRYALNILRGIYQGQTLFIFDHHYRIGNGKEESHIYGTMLMLVEKQAFPQLLIHHNSGQDRLEAVFGIGNEVKLESAEFSRAFSVRSQDKKFAFDVCNPQMMEFLLQNPDMRLEINGPIISLAFEPLLPVDRIELNLQRLAQIRSLMPDFLFTQNA
ncbi:MAG TPA: DUF3137 domain-containing protein [Verrucomicrobiae bacterium]